MIDHLLPLQVTVCGLFDPTYYIGHGDAATRLPLERLVQYVPCQDLHCRWCLVAAEDSDEEEQGRAASFKRKVGASKGGIDIRPPKHKKQSAKSK